MLCHRQESDRLKYLAEKYTGHSWADFGSSGTRHPELMPYVAEYTYSVGSIVEQHAHLITRAYPTVMTQLYFEFCGELSQTRNHQGKIDFGSGLPGGNSGIIGKRTYIKRGLGGWFDIWQIASARSERPVKNLKIDLYPQTLYQLFQLSPAELDREDLQLSDLLGAKTASLMLEEMEAAVSGHQLVEIAERYLLEQYRCSQSKHPVNRAPSDILPQLNQSLRQQAARSQKSERWLQRYYREVYGMSFKQMQTNLKFQRVLDLFQQAIRQKHSINLTEVAYQCGYFDQAHFIKAFRHFSGITPGQYLKQQAGSDAQQLFYW